MGVCKSFKYTLRVDLHCTGPNTPGNLGGLLNAVIILSARPKWTDCTGDQSARVIMPAPGFFSYGTWFGSTKQGKS